ncbi:hypothetical protein [Chitinasiproducens palmae]|uniref:Transcriptional regulator n=1 Tax=Chitinasiproducens palmae TaxID=1770053 RepID=A0A1H2PNY3_9BURK|nr:hypothetical protein [Chitinasiproducens palmae]SDV48415.1 hypothetical protein SAMN05216551_10573 [Chitinasiproducens palmae]
MSKSDERAAFSKRLEHELARLPEKVRGPTQLANQFNLRHQGERQITAQTADKWLKARAIPNEENLATLCTWFGVRYEWMRHGVLPREVPVDPLAYPLSYESLLIARQFETLDPEQRFLVGEMIKQLYTKKPPTPDGG